MKVAALLDSGAFAAWNRKETLDCKQYIEYVKSHKDLLAAYVNLDVMPGPGVSHEQAANGSHKNLMRMRDAGLDPMPVYHHGEGLDWLESLLMDDEPYIGLGGMAALKPEVKVKWLDQIFTLLTDKNGKPLVKVHGFGLTHPTLVMRYPWYSVDSSTWSMFPGYGPILVPQFDDEDGEPNFLAEPSSVVLSGNVQQSSRANAMQYQALTPTAQAMVDHWLRYVSSATGEWGIDFAEYRYKAGPRRRAMLVYFAGLARALRGVHFKHRLGLISQGAFERRAEDKPLKPWDLTIYHATAVSNKEFNHDLNVVGAGSRLISYYETRKRSYNEIKQYVTQGMIGEYAKQRAKPNWEGEAYLNQRRMGIKERFK